MRNTWTITGVAAGLAAVCTMGLCQTPPETILEIENENYIAYYGDVSDPAKLATAPSPTPAAPGFVFRQQLALGDIVAVNGKPVKGLLRRQ